ncbi:hypothetical protein BSKO_12576 [Bryopsis sp. KO-2023]|nr:hypothetical protein BSKO_12576 [Bryopsis sp. KO-2023]
MSKCHRCKSLRRGEKRCEACVDTCTCENCVNRRIKISVADVTFANRALTEFLLSPAQFWKQTRPTVQQITHQVKRCDSTNSRLVDVVIMKMIKRRKRSAGEIAEEQEEQEGALAEEGKNADVTCLESQPCHDLDDVEQDGAEASKPQAAQILKCTGSLIKEFLASLDKELADADAGRLEDVEVEPTCARRIECDRCHKNIPNLFKWCESCKLDYCVECCVEMRKIHKGQNSTCSTCASLLKIGRQLNAEVLEDLRSIVKVK